METNQNYLMAALQLLGSLGLLIYGMRMMSEALQKMAGPQLRHILARMTAKLPVVLAMFHTCFNVINTAILIWFVPQMERVVCWLLPEKKEAQEKEEFHLQYKRGATSL